MSKNLSLIVNLLPFVLLLGLLFLLVRNLHHRSVLSLTTSRAKIDYRRVLFSFSVVVILTIISFVISYQLDSTHIVWNFKPANFLLLLSISMLLFPFQIGLEEYLFRGYLMQQIGIVVKNRWIPLVLTSVIFGLFHAANPEVHQLGYGIMFFYISTGLLLGIMTLMDESIELALGFHLANNLMAALIITSDYSAIHTDAIFRYSGTEKPIAILIEMIVSIVIVYPIILFIFAKRFHWSDWKEKLFGKLD
jgi:membrane protease YdiL (CAAX protease family)